jgi:hypothetical protein
MNFDLDINNYTKNELYEMFELPFNCDINVFEMKESKIRENIINSKEINREIQKKTLEFLKKAKHILFNTNTNTNTNNNEFVNTIMKKIDFISNTSNELIETNLENREEHMVQVRNNTPYVNSFPVDYFPGVINPIKKKINHFNLNIDTKFRDNYYTTSSTNINIPLPLQINNVLSMSLSAIEIPLTIFNVSKPFGNNFFTVTLTDTNESKVVNIPSGNYDYTGLKNSINDQLNLLGGNFANIVFTINSTLTNNNANGSGQTIVGCAENTSFNYELNFQADKFGNDDKNTPLPLKLGWLLGFRNGIYSNNQNYVSEGIADITGSRYFYLVIDDYNNSVNNNFYSAFNSSLLNKNILARISLENSAINNTFQNTLKIVGSKREYYGPVNIQNMTVQLLDDYGRIIDLNNMDYSFCLSMDIVYDI